MGGAPARVGVVWVLGLRGGAVWLAVAVAVAAAVAVVVAWVGEVAAWVEVCGGLDVLQQDRLHHGRYFLNKLLAYACLHSP